MTSFWEEGSLLDYDAVIVGGGIIGLSTAVELAERAPSMSIAVLERGVIPAGASTRNAGFACFGSLTEIIHDIRTVGRDAALHTIDRRRRGLELLRDRLGDAAMDYHEHGGYELILDRHADAVDEVAAVNLALRDIFDCDLFAVRNDLIETFGFQETRALIFNPLEGQIDSGRMMRSMASLARTRGITILTGARVASLEDRGSNVALLVDHDPIGSPVEFRAGIVAVCANAYIPSLLPDLPIKPGRGQVLLTTPVEELGWQGTFHYDEGFYYFRNLGNRVLLGGGRNLAFEQETTAEFGGNELITHRLETMLRHVILPGRSFSIEKRWSGIMGFTPDKLPIVRSYSNNIVIGFGCNGMGIALASSIARETVELMTGG